MSRRSAGVLALTASIALGAPGIAYSQSTTVAEGSNLSAIAAANGVSLARLAAANGLAWDGHVVAGQSLRIPPADGFYTGPNGETLGYATNSSAAGGSAAPAAASAPAASSEPAAAGPGAPSGSSSSGSSSSGGGHRVAIGDTLSAIAARLGTSVQALAAANGITDPNLILAGVTLNSTAAGTTAAPAPASAPTPAANSGAGVASTSSTGPEGAPAANGSGAGTTNERVSSSQVSQIAGQHGVPGNLAAAIAWQESGNNNAMVSSAGARGVMQIMPGTWDWINSSLASPKLQTHSANDNVRAGSLFLRQLLNETGGDEATAIAGYYQGLSSVRSRGMYDDTKQYVKNVQAIKARLGG